MKKRLDVAGNDVIIQKAADCLHFGDTTDAAERPRQLAPYLQFAIEEAGIANGGNALALCLAIFERARLPVSAPIIRQALSDSGFAAWYPNEEPPAASFVTRRHVALQYDVGDQQLFVAALRPMDAERQYMQCARDEIRTSVLRELATTELEWPKEASPSEERCWARIDFLALHLRQLLLRAAEEKVGQIIRDAWHSPLATPAHSMRTQLDNDAATIVTDVLQDQGYVIEGLASDPLAIRDPHWRMTHRRLEESDDA